jgi:hypothetical protein
MPHHLTICATGVAVPKIVGHPSRFSKSVVASMHGVKMKKLLFALAALSLLATAVTPASAGRCYKSGPSLVICP